MSERLDACLECGALYPANPAREFCAVPCRKRWNNRRMTRGAELLDLYMAHRFERGLAKHLGLFQAINRLASNYRQEDKAERAGRKSWRNPRVVMEERVYLKAMGGRMRAGR